MTFFYSKMAVNGKPVTLRPILGGYLSHYHVVNGAGSKGAVEP